MRLAKIVVLGLLAGILLLACGDSEPVAHYDEKGHLTIMSYNVEDFDTGGRNETMVPYQEIAKIIKNSDVDVVCFQETQAGSATDEKYLDGSKGSWGDVTFFNRALTGVDYIMPYYGFNTMGSIRKDFVSYWSKYPVDKIASIRDEMGAIDPSTGVKYIPSRPFLRYRVKYHGKDLWFYGGHLKSNAGGVMEQNAGQRRAQTFHLARYIIRNQNPEKDLIVILGDMNTMPFDYDNSGNSTIDYLCLKFDNPYNTDNDFIPVNLTHIGAVTNHGRDTYGGQIGTTHPGNEGGYPDATFDHIILSPTLYNKYYVQDSIEIIPNAKHADHYPVKLVLQFTNND